MAEAVVEFRAAVYLDWSCGRVGSGDGLDQFWF